MHYFKVYQIPLLLTGLYKTDSYFKNSYIGELAHSPETAWSPGAKLSQQLLLIFMLKTLNS